MSPVRCFTLPREIQSDFSSFLLSFFFLQFVSFTSLHLFSKCSVKLFLTPRRDIWTQRTPVMESFLVSWDRNRSLQINCLAKHRWLLHERTRWLQKMGNTTHTLVSKSQTMNRLVGYNYSEDRPSVKANFVQASAWGIFCKPVNHFSCKHFR